MKRAILCPECRAELQKGASWCYHCSTQFVTEDPDKPNPPPVLRWTEHNWENCPRCGALDLERQTDVAGHQVKQNDPVRCTRCGLTGEVDIRESENSRIEWDDWDGYMIVPRLTQDED